MLFSLAPLPLKYAQQQTNKHFFSNLQNSSYEKTIGRRDNVLDLWNDFCWPLTTKPHFVILVNIVPPTRQFGPFHKSTSGLGSYIYEK